MVLDLAKAPYSLTKEDWGKIYSIGSYHTANSYDGDYTGELYCELFINDKRQALARYPDNDFLYTEEVAKTGLGKESDGALNNGWFTHAHIGSGDMWDALYESPWQSVIWQNAFPEYKTLTDDVSKSDSAEYIPNPACTVKGNLIFNRSSEIGVVYDSAYRFSDISVNGMYSLNKTEEIFVDMNSGNYNIKDVEKLRKSIPDFENIPLDKIGRVN